MNATGIVDLAALRLTVPDFQGRRLRPTTLLRDDRLSVAEWLSKTSSAEDVLRPGGQQNVTDDDEAPQSARAMTNLPRLSGGGGGGGAVSSSSPPLSARQARHTRALHAGGQLISVEWEQRKKQQQRQKEAPRMWKDIPVGVIATAPPREEGDSSQKSAAADGQPSPPPRQRKEVTLHLTMADVSALASPPGVSKRLAPFSHIIAMDAAEGRSQHRGGVGAASAAKLARPEDVNVNFKSWGLDDSYLRCLCSRISLQSVKGLNLSDNRLTQQSVDFLLEEWRLLQDERWQTLAVLLLPENRLSEGGGHAVARLIYTAQPSLRSLDLSSNALGDKGCEVLCDALLQKCHGTLKELALARNNIGQHDSGGIGIGRLVAKASGLERLQLDFNLLHGAGALAAVHGVLSACEAPRGSALACLDLSWNRLGRRCDDQLGEADVVAQLGATANFEKSGGLGAQRRPSSEMLLQKKEKKRASISQSGPGRPLCSCAICTTCSRIAKACEGIVTAGAALRELNLSYNGMCPEDTEAISQAAARRYEASTSLSSTGGGRLSASMRQTSIGGGSLNLRLQGNLLPPRSRTPERASC